MIFYLFSLILIFVGLVVNFLFVPNSFSSFKENINDIFNPIISSFSNENIVEIMAIVGRQDLNERL